MHQLLQLVATVCAGLFAGAALWAPAHRVVTLSQAPLALVGLFYAAGVWLIGGDVTWLVAAALIGIVVPSTLFHERPTWLHSARPAVGILAVTLMMYAWATGGDPSAGSAEQPREAQREQSAGEMWPSVEPSTARVRGESAAASSPRDEVGT